jgi:uncharacterized membrane protein YdfJ with MMPL/SSD domain
MEEFPLSAQSARNSFVFDRYFCGNCVTSISHRPREANNGKKQIGESIMKNPGAVMAVGLTAVIVMAIGVLNVVLSARNTGPAVAEEAAAQVGDATAVPDVAAVQAAYEARETLLALQNAQLDVELSERQKAYDSRVEELQALIGSGEEQLAQLEDQEAALQEQIDQLLLVQSERTAIYDSQRQQANAQYQVNIQQLQVQLDEGKSKLNEALARLGQ